MIILKINLNQLIAWKLILKFRLWISKIYQLDKVSAILQPVSHNSEMPSYVIQSATICDPNSWGAATLNLNIQYIFQNFPTIY